MCDLVPGPGGGPRYAVAVVRRAGDLHDDPAIQIVNPGEDTSPEAMAAWLAELDAGDDWLDLPVTAAELAPSDASWWAPDHLYVEAAAAVRKMRLRGLINAERADAALARLLALPVSVVRSKSLLREAWALRENLTVADAIYVVVARHLDGPLLTGDRRLAQSPNLEITVLHLSGATEP